MIYGRSYVKTYADSDVNAFIIASGITDELQTDSIDYLITNLKSNNLWSKMQAVYPMVGSTATNHKFNAKNPIDTDTAFRIMFTGGTHSANGFSGNGTGYGNTYFIPALIQNVNSNGVTLAIGTEGTGVQELEIGSAFSGTERSTLGSRVSGDLFVARFNGSNQTFANTDGKGIYTGQRTGATISNSWKNGIKKQTNNSGGTLPNFSFYIGALNNNGSVANRSIKRIQSVYIHQGLTDIEVPALHTIINTYENMLNRKTW